MKVIGSLLILCLCSWVSVEKVRPWKSFGFGRPFRYLSLLNFGAACRTKKACNPRSNDSIFSYSALAASGAPFWIAQELKLFERRKLHIN